MTSVPPPYIVGNVYYAWFPRPPLTLDKEPLPWYLNKTREQPTCEITPIKKGESKKDQ